MQPIQLARASGSAFGVDDISCAVATDLGLFRQQGIEPRWSDWRGGVAATNAVLEGKAEVGYAGFGPVLAARAQGKPVRIFVSQARALAQALIVRKDIVDPSQLRNLSWAVDGIGALSHHMSRLVVRGLKLSEADIRWEVVGPPPLRIAALLEGRVDAALIRTEEALALHRDHAGKVHRLLDFDELKKLVPLQPHGVLFTTEAWEQAHPGELVSLAKAMILAQRALYDRFEVFRDVTTANAGVKVSEPELRLLWQRETSSGGWAVNGELSKPHWEAQFDLYKTLYPDLRRVQRAEIIHEPAVPAALAALGRHPAAFDTTGS
jgi:ABC-type nitrate/sulfonate/bicarbonate transport system substrate-binding protein